MNWTTFLVCLCEIRQAMGTTPQSKDEFIRLVQLLEVRPNLHAAVVNVADSIVEQGAISKQCYCVRVCVEVQSWFKDLVSASNAVVVAENGLLMLTEDSSPCYPNVVSE